MSNAQLTELEELLTRSSGIGYISPRLLTRLLQRHPNESFPRNELPSLTDRLQYSSTHVLIPAALPAGLWYIQKLVPDLFGTNPWFRREQFFKGGFKQDGWYFFRREPQPRKVGEFDEKRLIEANGLARMPSTHEAVYAIFLHWAAFDRPLLKDVYINTRDVTSDGRRVCVASDHPGNIHIFPGKALIKGA